ncbi:MAG TPA: RraA family protein [Candidatus Binataceae bacterium]|nr:RraA family protein [Candidatus Binataceae bacterium]
MARLARFSTATLVECLHDYSAALPSAIKPIDPRMKLCGRAVTVSTPGGDNLMLHRAIYAAQRGDVLVVEAAGQFEFGYWGDVMTQAARARKLGGLVIDGCVRDLREITASHFALFARGGCIRGTSKRGGGHLNQPIVIGDSRIEPGHFIVGDRDGVVVIPPDRAAQVIEAAAHRVKHETAMKRELAAGESTLALHGWPAEDTST